MFMWDNIYLLSWERSTHYSSSNVGSRLPLAFVIKSPQLLRNCFLWAQCFPVPFPGDSRLLALGPCWAEAHTQPEPLTVGCSVLVGAASQSSIFIESWNCLGWKRHDIRSHLIQLQLHGSCPSVGSGQKAKEEQWVSVNLRPLALLTMLPEGQRGSILIP